MNIKKHTGSLISCDVCFKEIPKSTATTFEGEQYVWYFCGNACYKQFQNEIDDWQDEIEPIDKFSSES